MPAISTETTEISFSVRDPNFGEYDYVLYTDVVFLRNGNLLHVIDVGTNFHSVGSINKSHAVSTWKNLKNVME